MKTKLFFIISVLMIIGVNVYSQKKQSGTIQIILNNNQEVWHKNSDLNLIGRIVNHSKSKVTLISPRETFNFYPDLYSIVLSDDFKGSECAYSLPNSSTTCAQKYNFITVEAGKETEFVLRGSKYSLNYCNNAEISRDSIEVSIQYQGMKNEFTKESPFIKNNFQYLDEVELNKIIDYYNSLYPDSITSNIIKIKIEK